MHCEAYEYLLNTIDMLKSLLDDAVQNSNVNVGGGQVVGWIDTIPEDSRFKKQKAFIDWKFRSIFRLFQHLFQHLQAHVGNLGCRDMQLVDQQMAAFPRWSGLSHFSAVMELSFTDGSKEDIAKVAAQDLSHLIQEYDRRTEHEDLFSAKTHKSWNFPKAHTYKHVFDNIMNKGVVVTFCDRDSPMSRCLSVLIHIDFTTNMLLRSLLMVKMSQIRVACIIVFNYKLNGPSKPTAICVMAFDAC
ncbi:hypothetical protein L218DRAFT_951097 [Marasmius fiardii PR-910]|nr:hypothetical protein L218DRAFT_951097 [Marasmius fiardii PR-910]